MSRFAFRAIPHETEKEKMIRELRARGYEVIETDDREHFRSLKEINCPTRYVQRQMPDTFVESPKSRHAMWLEIKTSGLLEASQFLQNYVLATECGAKIYYIYASEYENFGTRIADVKNIAPFTLYTIDRWEHKDEHNARYCDFIRRRFAEMFPSARYQNWDNTRGSGTPYIQPDYQTGWELDWQSIIDHVLSHVD